MEIKNLEKCFSEASKQGKKYIGLKIWMYGFQKPEIIINPTENFGKKFDYYKNAYNSNLTLKNAPHKIKIEGFSYGDSFEELEKDLIE